ncbi:unnamed protein product [Ectocarpus sp. CCAP 1310/34]|nr:unnamed protein product [Ectocarpus sp. CCAP 1310/34]
MKGRNALKQTYLQCTPSGTFPPSHLENVSKFYSKCITREATCSLCVARLFFQRAKIEVSCDFGAALTGAALTENTLTLANGTFFLGKSACRSKIFVRHCYNETFQLIRKSAAQRNDGTTPKIVIVGTSGIGKSVFGFFLLYQLRLEGRTVVFERETVPRAFSFEHDSSTFKPQLIQKKKAEYRFPYSGRAYDDNFRRRTVVTLSSTLPDQLKRLIVTMTNEDLGSTCRLAEEERAVCERQGILEKGVLGHIEKNHSPRPKATFHKDG